MIGEKIFFVEASLIKGYGIVFEVSPTEGEECEVTGRTWKGDRVVKYNDWHWLKSPIPFKGFQGIRYIERDVWNFYPVNLKQILKVIEEVKEK